MNPVIHLRADLTPNVKKEMERALALACRNITAIPTPAVDPSVYKTPTVTAQRLALTINAKTHVLEYAELMLSAEFRIIHQFASASLVMKAILCEDVAYRKSVRLFCFRKVWKL